MKKNLIKLLILIVLISFYIAGCGHMSKVKIDDDIECAEEATQTSETVNRDYYIDATPSMKGYIVGSDNKKEADLTRYVRSLKLISEAGFNMSPNGEEHFWRVDVPLVEISKQEFEIEARKPYFYTLDFYKQTDRLKDKYVAEELEKHPKYGVAYFSQVIEHLNEKNLSIIVTDLYEDSSQVNRMTDLIYEKAFSCGLTMALICIDSEFNGKVYDVGEAGDSFAYGTWGEVKYHPLFFLIIGMPSDVQKFSNNLQDGLKTEKIEYNVDMFSDKYLAKPIGIQNIVSVKCERGDINYKQPTIELSESMEINAKAFSLKRAKKGERELDLLFKGEPSIVCGMNLLDQASKKPLDTSITFEKYKGNDSKAGSYSILENPERYLEVVDSGTLQADGQYSFKLKFKNSMPNVGVIRIRVTSHIDLELSVPKWITDRNMPINELLRWRENPKAFRGDTTLYLERTYTVLAATYSKDKKFIACDYYLYFNIER